MNIRIAIIISIVAGAASACSPAILLPPANEPLDSVAWEDCVNQGTAREGSSLIDDLTMDSKTLLCKGVVLCGKEETLEEGLEVLNEAAVTDKEDHRPYYLQGRILTDAGRYEEALTAFSRANKRFGEMEVPSETLGRSVLKERGSAEALQFVKKAEERGHCNYGCLALLANLHHMEGNADEARTRYAQLVEEYPQEPSAFIGLAGLHHNDKEYAKEAELIAAAIQTEGFSKLSDEQKASIYYSEAFSLFSGDNLKDAKEALERALAIEQHAQWWLLAGRIHAGLGDPALAGIKFDKAIGMENGLIDAHIGKGDSFMVLGQVNDAVETYKNATFIAPANQVVKLKLALAYVKADDLKSARIQLDDAIKLGEDSLPAALLKEITTALEANDAKPAAD